MEIALLFGYNCSKLHIVEKTSLERSLPHMESEPTDTAADDRRIGDENLRCRAAADE
jgi:hypothetical protein